MNSNTNIYKVESRVQSRVQVPVLLLAYTPGLKVREMDNATQEEFKLTLINFYKTSSA